MVVRFTITQEKSIVLRMGYVSRKEEAKLISIPTLYPELQKEINE